MRFYKIYFKKFSATNPQPNGRGWGWNAPVHSIGHSACTIFSKSAKMC
jgi:hypothetical protein